MNIQTPDNVPTWMDQLKTALLVAGTMIGGGMLALPVLTSSIGFLPTIVVYLVCHFAMTMTGLYLFEVATACPSDANLISMAQKTLGSWAKVCSWILYLFLFYSLMTAYTAGVGQFMAQMLQLDPSSPYGLLCATALFFPLILLGLPLLSSINTLLVLGLVLSFGLFVLVGMRHVSLESLAPRHWSMMWTGIAISFTSFSYQGIVPSAARFLRYDPVRTKRVIWIGTLIPLLIYTLWQALVVGIVPLHGLESAKMHGYSAVIPLQDTLQLPVLETVGTLFGFFALFTSFIGVSLGLFDFLSDGLSLRKEGVNLVTLALLVLVPPLLINVTIPGLFLDALVLAGGIGCALLLGVLPCLMVKKLRKQGFSPLTWGGYGLINVLLFFFICEVILELGPHVYAWYHHLMVMSGT